MGHIEVGVPLLERGAGIEAQVNDGGTPLHIAAAQGHSEVVELLLEWGGEK
jgi:ankyrin repeat protein